MRNLHIAINKRLFLKNLHEYDAESLFLLVDHNRDHLREWLPWVDGNTHVEHSLEFIRIAQLQMERGLGPICGVFFDNELCGVCGFHPYDNLNHCITLGYWLAKSACGKGIATECTKTMVNFAFETLQVNKVCISAAIKNVASRRIPTKLMMVNDGINRDGEFLNGRYHDLVMYSLLKDEWQAIKSSVFK